MVPLSGLGSLRWEVFSRIRLWSPLVVTCCIACFIDQLFLPLFTFWIIYLHSTFVPRSVPFTIFAGSCGRKNLLWWTEATRKRLVPEETGILATEATVYPHLWHRCLKLSKSTQLPPWVPISQGLLLSPPGVRSRIGDTGCSLFEVPRSSFWKHQSLVGFHRWKESQIYTQTSDCEKTAQG